MVCLALSHVAIEPGKAWRSVGADAAATEEAGYHQWNQEQWVGLAGRRDGQHIAVAHRCSRTRPRCREPLPTGSSRPAIPTWTCRRVLWRVARRQGASSAPRRFAGGSAWRRTALSPKWLDGSVGARCCPPQDVTVLT